MRAAVSSLVDPGSVFALSPRHVTISTVGVTKNIYRMTQDMPHVNLALSLHAPDQETRLRIIPTAGAHKIGDLMEAVDNHIVHSRRVHRGRRLCAMIEYILIKDVNDTAWHAHQLGNLLCTRKDVLLNLIPYNPTDAGELQGYEEPEQERINIFFDIITSKDYAVFTRMRHEMGQDVDAACGQLAVSKQSSGGRVRDIEDISVNPLRSSSLSANGYRIAYFHDMMGAISDMLSADKMNDDSWGKLFAASAVATGLIMGAVVVFRATRFRD